MAESFLTSLFTFCFISIHFQVEKETTEIKLNIKFKKYSQGKYWTKLMFCTCNFKEDIDVHKTSKQLGGKIVNEPYIL